MSRILSIQTALPDHVIPQVLAKTGCALLFAKHPELARLLKVFDRCGVKRRHFSFPTKYYLSHKSFDRRNEDFIEKATALAEEAGRRCLERAGVRGHEVDHLVLVTTTGLATPSLDALLVPRLGLGPQTRRWPLFGLGCAGGAGALIRADEILRGHPDERVLVISVELCGQIFSTQATDPVDAVGAALFGDGAVAVLVAGDETGGGGPRILATRSVLFEDSKHIMGWRFTSDGMRLVLSPEVTDLLRRNFRSIAEDFLLANGFGIRDVRHWVLHPGGRRILEAYQEALDCPDTVLSASRESLANVGNLSSASVLFVLAKVMEGAGPREGERALVAAPGPGFGMEMLVLGW